ncbi:MAG: YidC/Oxa1 family insertase periplasmic-domain containing protein [Phycisphaerales bacterium]|jgi:YidC/Oxa1 family membrane protein insertase
MRIILILVVVCFVVFCGLLVVESGFFKIPAVESERLILLQSAISSQGDEAAEEPVEEVYETEADDSIEFGADSEPATSVTLGSVDPNSGYKFELELSSKGAAIRKATFSEFNDRDYKNPKPLVILSPSLEPDGREILSMANANLVFVERELQLPLDRLHWRDLGKEVAGDGSQTARFEAIIKVMGTNEPAMRLVKTYRIVPDSYLLNCRLTVENLLDAEQKVRINLTGPGGLSREGFRADMRKVLAGFRETDGQISRVALSVKDLSKAQTIEKRRLKKPGANFLWAAVINKYFAAILVPLPDEGKEYCDWIMDKTGRIYNPDRDRKFNSGDETMGLGLATKINSLTAAGQAGNLKTYNFQLYVGPKDKSLFDKNEQYRNLGFVQTIDFMACCCPAGLIKPLAFGILALMKWMYSFIGNYGIVIFILVFFVRLALHPLTKKSQISMSKMSRLAPMAEEIKKKYANNKAEMNKQMMALYREQGASPIMGMLPMMVQMPILIALWTAIYTSIDLRGAPFLPFWITDLSMPDALIRFHAVTLPLFGKLDSFNLLPILMGVAMYMQQALMPSQAASNPQVAQQQKMMKIMFPIMLPLILYKGPSGVNLYFMASTFAGVIEQKIIRKHIKEKEEAESKGKVAVTSKTGGKVKKKKPKPFFKT